MFDMLFGNGDIESIFHSLTGVAWVLIPLTAIVWFIVRALAEERTRRHDREMLHRERIAAFEKGMTDALERSIAVIPKEKPSNPNSPLIGGIVTIGVGFALMAFFGVALRGEGDRNQAIAIGLIPLIIGIALIVAWAVSRRLKNGNGERPAPPN